MSGLPSDQALPNSPPHSTVPCHADPHIHTHHLITAHSSATQDDGLGYSHSHSFSPPRDVASPTVYLPTPRTRSPAANVTAYLPVVTRSPESPSMYARLRVEGVPPLPSLVPRIRPTIQKAYASGSLSQDTGLKQIVTPETSPKTILGSVIRRPSSAPTLGKVEEQSYRVKLESPPLPLAPAPIIASPRTFHENPRPPVAHVLMQELSSPFVVKSQSTARSTQKDDLSVPVDAISMMPNDTGPGKTSPQEINFRKPATPTLMSNLAPRAASDTDLQYSLENRLRQPGGELDRIRSQWSQLEQARAAELESRRPDYLKRLKRPESSALSFQENRMKGNESLGITETPLKGRRLQLFDFQETSAESFEESLMTHGYGKYGEPRTPQRPITAADGRSQEAMAWLAQHTPNSSALSSSASQAKSDADQSEREHKKRRRLEAFKSSAARAYSKLYAANVEGMGRILLNIPPEGFGEVTAQPPLPKRRGRKRKGAAAADKKGKTPDRPPVESVTTPRWLDDEYPWCLREKERKEKLDALDADRLRWIERYFGRDSDTDEDDMDVDRGFYRDFCKDIGLEAEASGIHSVEEAQADLKNGRGRGKVVPLQRDPARQKHRSEENGEECHPILFPTDPADARTALLSKRSVRHLVRKRLRREHSQSSQASTDGRLNCICGRAESEDEEVGGRSAVQCDECFDWHHLECIGVRDASELGSEDDPWYCSRCRPPMRSPNLAEQRLPTFVPTEEAPVRTSARHDVAFYSSSPIRGWLASDTLRTPNYGHRERGSHRRSLWDEIGADPRTPVDVRSMARIFSTPKQYDGDSEHITRSPVSRSMLGHSRSDPFVTPKRSTTGMGMPWDPSGQASATPRGRLPSASYGFGYNPDDSGGNIFNAPYARYARSHAMMYGMDDTPISRTRTTKEMHTPTRSLGMLPPAPALPSHGESPLAGRGEWAYTTPLYESPVARFAGVKREKERDGIGVGGGEGAKANATDDV